MQLIIKHDVKGELRLPLNYHHILQAVIYHSLGDNSDYNPFLHDEGYAYEMRTFKAFTFGPLLGKYQIEGKDIIFLEDVTFEVRSVDDFFLKTLQKNIQKNGLTYLKQHYDNVLAVLDDYTIEEEEIIIDMISPVCQYCTDEDTGKTYFYMPTDEEFAYEINANFRRKYEAYYGKAPDEDIYIEPVQLSLRDKYVTKYKGFYITAWKGRYVLSGRRKYLDFLYQVGIGCKNSQGFGMFEEVVCF